MGHYALAEHVFCCLHQDEIVVLDAKENRYKRISASQAASAALIVSGWPACSNNPDLDRAQREVSVLLRRGWVVESEGVSTRLGGREFQTPTADLQANIWRGCRLGAMPTIGFCKAVCIAKLHLRFRKFHDVISRLSRRKAAQEAVAVQDEEVSRQRVGEFERLRVLSFTSKNQCLYNSLALAEYLAHFSIYPDLVFGVRTRPFAAHAWLQQGHRVLNDTVDFVLGYTPIMRI